MSLKTQCAALKYSLSKADEKNKNTKNIYGPIFVIGAWCGMIVMFVANMWLGHIHG